jgi:hypothetical protein
VFSSRDLSGRTLWKLIKPFNAWLESETHGREGDLPFDGSKGTSATVTKTKVEQVLWIYSSLNLFGEFSTAPIIVLTNVLFYRQYCFLTLFLFFSFFLSRFNLVSHHFSRILYEVYVL